MSRQILIANAILKYETEFNGSLKNGYKTDKEFLKDITSEIKINGTNELIEYYKTYVVSMNDTNSTSEKRLAIKELILLLDGYDFKISDISTTK